MPSCLARKNLFFLQAILTCCQLFSQKIISQTTQDNFPFNHIEYITSAQGLNDGEITAATQDRNGFMWFATSSGLNRFDGYSFRSYSYRPDDPGSPSTGYFSSLTEDKNGILWMRSNYQGVYSFDPYQEKFTKYTHQPGNGNSLTGNWVSTMDLEGDSIIWAATINRLRLERLDPKTKSFTHVNTSDIYSSFSSDSDRFISCIVTDKPNRPNETQQNLWLVSSPDRSSPRTIVSLFETKTRKVAEEYDFPFPAHFSVDAFAPGKIKTDVIWFGSDDNGIYGFNTLTRKFIIIKPGHPCRSTSGHLIVSGIFTACYPVMEDHDGNLWTTNDDNEIVYYDRKNSRFYFKLIPGDKVRFIHQPPRIFEDHGQKVWLCTNNGLITVDTRQKKIYTCRHIDNDPTSVSGDFVYGIKRVKNGPLFVGSGNALDTFDRKARSFSRFPLSVSGKGIDNSGIWIIYEDSKNNIWFAGYPRTICYNRSTKNSRQYETFMSDSGRVASEQCVGFIEDRKGRYWVGQFVNGLYSLDPATGKVRGIQVEDKPNSLSTNSLSVFFQDSKGVIYMNGWDGGFIAFNPDSETFKIYHHDPKDPTSVSNDNDHVFLEAKNGLIWFGSFGGGINVFNPATGKFKAFTTKDGLAHNSVSSLIADKNGNYWAGTFGGLSCFHLPDDPFDPRCKIKFRNYDVNDGLPSNQLNWSSAFCDTDGTLYFGTRGQGLFYFNPDSLKDNDFVPPVYITEFKLKNKLVSVHDSNSVLRSPVEFTREIKLNYKQNIISFSFAALNYTHAEKNQYAYTLEGYDKDWIYTDASKRFANYTNLDPKTYTFKVKGSNNDGKWNDIPTEIKITITPPFWQTTWFAILVAVTALGVVYAFYRYRIGQILLLQRIRNKIASDLHDDIGSTLNSISVYSEVAKKDAARKDFALNMIGESSRKIIDSMSDIVWSINPENDSFDKIIFRMRSLTYNLLKAKKIDCTFKADEGLAAVKLPMNTRRNFYLIFKEALNNLVKYSKAERANVALMYENRQVVLIVRDDGVGFDVFGKYNGNGLNNIRKRAREINARLNIESANGAGTTVELSFKI
jgi:ligand-binding sensor domain-containing protein/two-component sensor histidine kinase